MSKLNVMNVVVCTLLPLFICSNVVANSEVVGAPDPSLFLDGALTEEVTTVDCTLSDGTETQCYRISIAGAPADAASPEGPFCPSSITSSAEEGGTWSDGAGNIYQVDGAFIENLASFYNDPEWAMFDEDTGAVIVIDGAYGCELAGDPNSDPPEPSFCLECTTANMDGGVVQTALIPTQPKLSDAPSRLGRGNLGIALNGVLLGPPAPLQLILSSHTLGVFDDCGGHGNPLVGYHYHESLGCAQIVDQSDGHAALMGYALDGFSVYAYLDTNGEKPGDLDECGGQTDDLRGYHYHAGAPGTNSIIGCLSGAYGEFEGDAESGAGGPGGEGGPGGPRPEGGGPPPE